MNEAIHKCPTKFLAIDVSIDVRKDKMLLSFMKLISLKIKILLSFLKNVQNRFLDAENEISILYILSYIIVSLFSILVKFFFHFLFQFTRN